jgi:hypothetical protein
MFSTTFNYVYSMYPHFGKKKYSESKVALTFLFSTFYLFGEYEYDNAYSS